MREEGWLTLRELLDSSPAIADAMRLISEEDYLYLYEELEGSGAEFFNQELREFSNASDWSDLHEQSGVPYYPLGWGIPTEVPVSVADILRGLRNLMHALLTRSHQPLPAYGFNLFVGDASSRRITLPQDCALVREFVGDGRHAADFKNYLSDSHDVVLYQHKVILVPNR